MVDAGLILKSVHRAIADLRRGGMVICSSERGEVSLVLAAEQVTDARLETLAAKTVSSPSLLLSPKRAEAIDLKPRPNSVACSVLLSKKQNAEDILRLIGDLPLEKSGRALTVVAEKEGNMAEIVLMLMRAARLMPAALASHVSEMDEYALRRWAKAEGLLIVEEAAIRSFELTQAQLLREVARARLPLEGAEETNIVLFRPDDGGLEHFALLVNPNSGKKIAKPPLVRIHSQCITGDILGSLKCDCGSQLRKSLQQMAESEGGVLVYLAQEGRDIGLVNKLKAYALQDNGLDTVEANHALGFETDHRFFLPAAEILRQLGYTSIRLLTNNPDKIDQVQKANIKITERIPLITETNPHNQEYIKTKKTRTGHLMD